MDDTQFYLFSVRIWMRGDEIWGRSFFDHDVCRALRVYHDGL